MNENIFEVSFDLESWARISAPSAAFFLRKISDAAGFVDRPWSRSLVISGVGPEPEAVPAWVRISPPA